MNDFEKFAYTEIHEALTASALENLMNQTEQFELGTNEAVPDLAEAICEGFVCESLHVDSRGNGVKRK